MAKTTTKQKIEKLITKKKKDIEEEPEKIEHSFAEEVEPLIPHVEPVIEVQVDKPIVEVPFIKVVDAVEIQEEVKIELIPKFKEAEIKKIKEENQTDVNQMMIKNLRIKLENGTISDGEAAELFRLLAS